MTDRLHFEQFLGVIKGLKGSLPHSDGKICPYNFLLTPLITSLMTPLITNGFVTGDDGFRLAIRMARAVPRL